MFGADNNNSCEKLNNQSSHGLPVDGLMGQSRNNSTEGKEVWKATSAYSESIFEIDELSIFGSES